MNEYNMINMSNVNLKHKNNSRETTSSTYYKFRRIVIRDTIYQQLKELGRAGDSFNDVITKILAEQKDENK